MRILDNCTYECDAAVAIANEMYEMQKGAGMSESQTTTALQKLVGKRTHTKSVNVLASILSSTL